MGSQQRSTCTDGGGPTVQVGVTDPGVLDRLFREPGVRADACDNLALFGTVGLQARSLLSRFPLDGRGIRPGQGTRVFLVAVGDSALVRSVVQLAARIGHFANDTSVSIWVLGHEPAAQPAPVDWGAGLDRAAEVRVIAGDPSRDETWREVLVAMAAQPAWAILAFADEQGSVNLRRAAAVPLLPEGVEGVATVILSSEPDLAASLGRIRPRVGGRLSLHAFLPVVEAITADNVFREAMDAIARGIHEHYLRGQRAAGRLDPENPAHRPWSRLDADFKDANRSQADHIVVKLRALGLEVRSGSTGGPGAFAPTTTELEALSRAEHRRWNADRLLAGWTWGPVKDVASRRTPYLCAWADLAEDVREWDRRAVLAIPDVLALAGLGIQPVSGGAIAKA